MPARLRHAVGGTKIRRNASKTFATVLYWATDSPFRASGVFTERGLIMSDIKRGFSMSDVLHGVAKKHEPTRTQQELDRLSKLHGRNGTKNKQTGERAKKTR